MDISRSLLSQVGGWELRSGGCRQGSSRATTAIYHAGMLSRVCLATGRWREADFPLGVALSAQCGRNVERAPREGGQRRSLQSCARDRYQHAPETGGCFASRCLKAPAPPAAGLFFDLPGLASFINLLFSTSQSRAGRAVFTVGQSREKRAFGRGDW
jgi:hypothetical protein